MKDPIINFIRKIEASHLLQQRGMPDHVECLGEVQGKHTYEWTNRQHVDRLTTVCNKVTSAAVVEPVGLKANWSVKQSPGGGCCKDG